MALFYQLAFEMNHFFFTTAFECGKTSQVSIKPYVISLPSSNSLEASLHRTSTNVNHEVPIMPQYCFRRFLAILIDDGDSRLIYLYNPGGSSVMIREMNQSRPDKETFVISHNADS